MIKVIDVAYPILQVPSLNKQEAFLKDFGLVTTKRLVLSFICKV